LFQLPAMQKNSAICGLARSRNSAQCGIARSRNSALCGIARSRNSSLCHIVQSHDSELQYAALRGVLKKVLSATLPYATQCEIQVKNFLVDSTLCSIARSQCLLSNLIEYLRKFESICETVSAHESGDPGVYFNEKTEGRKSRETVLYASYTLSNFLQLSL
jgi:hypothetical protein